MAFLRGLSGHIRCPAVKNEFQVAELIVTDHHQGTIEHLRFEASEGWSFLV